MTVEKKQRRDAEENKRKILATACDLFAAKGSDIAISEIAKTAQIGVGTIYRHFPNKTDLFEAANQAYQQQFVAESQHYLDNPDDEAAFFGFIRYVLQRSLGNRALFDAFQNNTCQFIEPTGEILELQNVLVILLQRAQQSSLVAANLDIRTLMLMLSGVIMMSTQLDKHSDADLATFEKATTFFEQGIRR